MTLMLVARFGCSALLGAVVCAQQLDPDVVWVDAGGGGDYTEIQDAVDAAQDGALIRVRHGIYEGFTVQKAVRVIGMPAVGFEEDQRTAVTSPIEISDVSSAGAVVVADIESIPRAGLDPYADLFFVSSCDAPVFIFFSAFGHINVSDSQLVCIGYHKLGALRASGSLCHAVNSIFSAQEGYALSVSEKSVSLTNSSVGLVQPQRMPRVHSSIVSEGGLIIRDANSAFIPPDPRSSVYPVALGDGGGAVVRNLVNYCGILSANSETLSVGVVSPNPSLASVLAVGAVQSTPLLTPSGYLWLDPSTSSVIGSNVTIPDGGAPHFSFEVLPLPEALRPSRFRQTSLNVSPGSPPLSGVPVAIQGGYWEADGRFVLTMPVFFLL